MPAYEFELLVNDNVVGRATLALPVDDRDKVTLRRNPFPRTLAISTFTPTEQETQGASMLNACKRIESRIGTSEFERRTHMPSQDIKNAWGANQNRLLP